MHLIVYVGAGGLGWMELTGPSVQIKFQLQANLKLRPFLDNVEECRDGWGWNLESYPMWIWFPNNIGFLRKYTNIPNGDELGAKNSVVDLRFFSDDRTLIKCHAASILEWLDQVYMFSNLKKESWMLHYWKSAVILKVELSFWLNKEDVWMVMVK